MLGSNLVNLVILSKYTVISDYTMYEMGCMVFVVKARGSYFLTSGEIDWALL